MRRFVLAVVATGVSCAVLFATGCGSSSAKLRLVNAVPVQSNLDMLIDGKNVAAAIPYGAASPYVAASTGSRHLQIEPTGQSNPFVDETINLSSGYSSVLETTAGTNVLVDTNTAPSSGNVNIRVINASSNVGTADVYIVTSGTGIGTTPTFSSVAFPSATGYQSVAAGAYQVIFTSPGTTNIIFSSGSLQFASGQVRSVVALDGQTGGITNSVLADLN